MGKLILVVLILLGAAWYVPRTRAMLQDVARPAMAPLHRWMTEREADQIAQEFGVYLRSRGNARLARGEFDSWLTARFPRPDARVDAWGGGYDARVNRTNFRITSAGPDGQLGTQDDIAVERPLD